MNGPNTPPAVGIDQNTLVIFMGITMFGEIARELIARGRPANTPVLAVRWATRPDQQTLAGTLATLPGLIKQHGMKPPATIVVGDVVSRRRRYLEIRRVRRRRPAADEQGDYRYSHGKCALNASPSRTTTWMTPS